MHLLQHGHTKTVCPIPIFGYNNYLFIDLERICAYTWTHAQGLNKNLSVMYIWIIFLYFFFILSKHWINHVYRLVDIWKVNLNIFFFHYISKKLYQHCFIDWKKITTV